MEKFVDFVTNHWMLSLLLVLVGVAWAIQEWIQSRNSVLMLSAEQLVQLMNHQSPEVYDIRSPADYSNGHILHAQNVAPDAWDRKIENGKVKKIAVLVCNNGRESQRWATRSKTQQVQLYVLEGGLESWKTAGLPLVQQ